MSNLQNITIHFPGKLTFGSGCIAGITDDLVRLGCKSVFIITIKPLLGQLGALIQDIEAKGIKVSTDTGVEQEPTFTDFEKLIDIATQADPDAVIGIGGGSVLDVAKLVAAQLNNTQTLNDIVGIGMLKGRSKVLMCAPATAGTGSEVSPNAILVDDADHHVHPDGAPIPGAGVFPENDGPVVHDCVDPGDLLDDCQDDGQDERLAQRFAQEFTVGSGGLGRNGFTDVLQFPIDRCVRRNALEHCAGLVFPVHLHQPSRALRDPRQRYAKQQRGHGADAEHPPPIARSHLSERVVADKGAQDPDDNRELVKGHQSPAHVGGRDLREIEGRDQRSTADGQTAQCPRDDQLP